MNTAFPNAWRRDELREASLPPVPSLWYHRDGSWYNSGHGRKLNDQLTAPL